LAVSTSLSKAKSFCDRILSGSLSSRLKENYPNANGGAMFEILSPVGSPNGLSAPMDGGCDAVYLGGKAFGARAMAHNFSDKELEGAVGYAHDRGVKVYVTVNTLIKQDEMADAVSFVRFLSDIGADAVLVQDLGLLRSIARYDISKHASTQMQIHSLDGLRWCAENGLDRAVLARELTMDDLSKIVPESPIDTEVFIQGGMCYCMSGGCYMSAYINGLSGNRGQCQRPCRSRYSMNGGSGLLTSMTDLEAVPYVKELERLGVRSLKIEGRAKKPVYAYLTAKIYSMVRDGRKGPELDEAIEQLRIVFNRGTSPGYLEGVQPIIQPMFSDSRGLRLCDVGIRNSMMPGTIEHIGPGDRIMVCNGLDVEGVFTVKGNTDVKLPFKVKDGTYEIRKVSSPEIRTISEKYEDAPQLNGHTARKKVDMRLKRRKVVPRKPELSFYVSDLETLEAALPYADRVYFDNPVLVEKAAGRCGDVEFVRMLPRFDALGEYGHDGSPVMISNPGQYLSCRDAPRVYASNVMNIFNLYAVPDVFQTTLSIELSGEEMKEFMMLSEGRFEAMVFGRLEVMFTREPSLGAGVMTDEKGRTFHAYRDALGFTRIQNSSDLDITPDIDVLGHYGIASAGLDLRNRPPELAEAVGEMCQHPDQEKHDRLFDLCGRRTMQSIWLRGVR